MHALQLLTPSPSAETQLWSTRTSHLSIDQTEAFRFSMMLFEQLSIQATYHEHSSSDLLGLRRALETQVAAWTKRGWFASWWESNKWMMPPHFEAVVEEIIIKNLPNEECA